MVTRAILARDFHACALGGSHFVGCPYKEMFNYREAGRTNQYSHHKSSPSLLRERARYNKTLCTSAEITEGRINISTLHALSGKYRIMFVHVRIASIVNKLSVQKVRDVYSDLSAGSACPV